MLSSKRENTWTREDVSLRCGVDTAQIMRGRLMFTTSVLTVDFSPSVDVVRLYVAIYMAVNVCGWTTIIH